MNFEIFNIVILVKKKSLGYKTKRIAINLH
jgi:hypothetical protein